MSRLTVAILVALAGSAWAPPPYRQPFTPNYSNNRGQAARDKRASKAKHRR